MVTALIPYRTAVESSVALNMNPPSPMMHTTGRSGLATFAPSAVGEGKTEVERVAGIYVGLWVVYLVMGAGVVAELGHVSDREGLLWNGVLDGFQDRELGLLEADVVVCDEAPGCPDRVPGGRPLPCSRLYQEGQ